jgi:hypothetical protein
MLVTSIAAVSSQHAVSRSPAVTILLVLAALLLGVVVGVVPVVVFRLAAGGGQRRRPPAARRPRARAPRPQPLIFEPRPLDEPVVALPSVGAVAVEPLLEPVEPAPVEVVSDRHRDLYHREYSRQLDRVETLRQAIRMRIAVGVASQPDDPAMEVNDP